MTDSLKGPPGWRQPKAELSHSLKERLSVSSNYEDNYLKHEALARIEELETDIKDYAYNLDNFRCENDQLQATIAKLEGEIAAMKHKDWDLENDALLKRNDTLQGKLDRAIEGLERIASPGWLPRPEDFMSITGIARSILSDLKDETHDR